MTSEVIEVPCAPPQGWIMQTSTPAVSTEATARSPWPRARVLAAAVLTVFTAYSSWVTVDQGYLAFVDVALAGGWSTQVFADLGVALLLVTSWLIRDARTRQTPAWPWLLGTFALGSISPLLYLVVRPGTDPTA